MFFRFAGLPAGEPRVFKTGAMAKCFENENAGACSLFVQERSDWRTNSSPLGSPAVVGDASRWPDKSFLTRKF